MKKTLFHLGRYYLLMARVFSRPEDIRIYLKQTIKEIEKIGLNSIGIVAIISAFMGAVITMQTAYNIDSAWVPLYLVGFTARDSILLEFSSTIVGLILAGKVGSSIASEIGTMRVTEQIDALEIMGINSASYLILPKIAAAMFINPFLNIVSIVVGLVGGWVAAAVSLDVVSTQDYIEGLHYWFIPFYVVYSFIKTWVFAFILASVPSYHGYYASGGALEVGRSSTQAVVYSSVLILLFNVILTQVLLAK